MADGLFMTSTPSANLDSEHSVMSSSLASGPDGIGYCSHSYNFTQAYSTLHVVQMSYTRIHPYVTMIICIYGIITNIINIIVFTKPSMRNSVNCILTGIAVADIVTMSSCIPFAYFYYLMPLDLRKTSLPWIRFMAIHMNLTLITYTSSIWLGVIMAAMRYFFVRSASRGAQSVDIRSTLMVILATFLGATMLIVPNCLSTGLKPCFENDTGLVNWHITVPSFGGQDSNTLHMVTFFIYPVAGKIIPCTLISIFGGLLLHTLKETDKRARRLKGESSSNANGNNQNRRTTIMLLVIITLYIISELPQSILVLLCIFVKDFFREVYALLGDFIDLLALVNSALNFVTYIAMSTQFRKTLAEMSCACLKTVSCKRYRAKNAIQSTKYTVASTTAV